MSVSRCLFILPLGLLITVSGCSGSRMRQIFAPDREFMALSELEEYDAQSVADRYAARRNGGLLASLSRDRTEDDAEQTADENSRLLSLSRWLPSRRGEDLPDDPFVGLDADDADTEATEAVVAAEPAADANDPMVTVGLSRELPADPVDPVDDDDDFVFDPSIVATPPEDNATDPSTSSDRSDLPTFADIMAELEDEAGPEDNSDELDQLAEAWLAAQSEPEEEAAAEEPVLSDFEALLAEATEGITPATAADDDVPGLDFDQPIQEPEYERAEQLVAMAEVPEAAEGIDQPIDAAESATINTVDQLVERDSRPELPLALPGDSLSETDDIPPARQPSELDTEVAQSESPADLPADEDTVDMAGAPFADVTDDGRPAPADEPFSIAAEQPATRPQVDDFESIRSDFRPPAFRHPATGLQPSSLAAESGETARRADAFDDTRFLNDFESQVTATTTAPVAAPPAATTGNSIISRQSPRTWLLLLGAVIIGYLLLAPERHNLRHSNNR